MQLVAVLLNGMCYILCSLCIQTTLRAVTAKLHCYPVLLPSTTWAASLTEPETLLEVMSLSRGVLLIEHYEADFACCMSPGLHQWRL